MVEEPETVIADTPPAPAHGEPTPAFTAEAPVVEEPAGEPESAQQPGTEDQPAPEDDIPSVDSLQGRLADLQAAMDQLQSGDLDGAEATIASLEESLSDARQEHGLT